MQNRISQNTIDWLSLLNNKAQVLSQRTIFREHPMGGDSQELGDYFFESVLRVPANCLGFQTFSVGQLKVVQQPLKLDYP